MFSASDRLIKYLDLMLLLRPILPIFVQFTQRQAIYSECAHPSIHQILAQSRKML